MKTSDQAVKALALDALGELLQRGDVVDVIIEHVEGIYWAAIEHYLRGNVTSTTAPTLVAAIQKLTIAYEARTQCTNIEPS